MTPTIHEKPKRGLLKLQWAFVLLLFWVSAKLKRNPKWEFCCAVCGRELRAEEAIWKVFSPLRTQPRPVCRDEVACFQYLHRERLKTILSTSIRRYRFY